MHNMKGIVVRKKKFAQDHFILWIKPTEPLHFEPGQYITVGKEGTERPYSIASAPHEENIELFLEVVPKTLETNQSLTPRLYALEPGEEVQLRPHAKGKFTLNPTATTHIMIATVTGIAPFVSMVRAYLHGYYKRTFEKTIYVFQGASYQDELGYDTELSLAAQKGAVVYIPSISRPQEERNKNWKGQTGRVNLILNEYLQRFHLSPNDQTTVYLCGNKGMIEYLGNKREKPEKPLGTLVQAGFKIREEVFF